MNVVRANFEVLATVVCSRFFWGPLECLYQISHARGILQRISKIRISTFCSIISHAEVCRRPVADVDGEIRGQDYRSGCRRGIRLRNHRAEGGKYRCGAVER